MRVFAHREVILMRISGIGGIGSVDATRNIYSTQRVRGIQKITERMSNGNKINSAADNAANLAIAEKLLASSNGLDASRTNALTGRDLLNTSDGALGSIQDSLQRMRELSLQASNSAINSPKDIRAIQGEIDQLKGFIQDTAKGTQFNTVKLLDGNMADLNLATNPKGGGLSIQMANSTLENLGIANYDVTGSFDIRALDNAIAKVSTARGNIGASANGLERISDYNSSASLNLNASRSQIKDLDYAEAAESQRTEQVLEQYRMSMQQKVMESSSGILRLFA